MSGWREEVRMIDCGEGRDVGRERWKRKERHVKWITAVWKGEMTR